MERGIERLKVTMEKQVRGLVEAALRSEAAPVPAESKARGKRLRADVPRASHARWEPAADRPDPVELLKGQGAQRVPELLPVRYERMAASAFAFYRGAALVMASDLSRTPSTGITVQACGDAHISNFGLFNSPERHTVFDINDFDETLPGPWEWDVKRLAASVEICGRDRGFSPGERAELVRACVKSYRTAMRGFASKGNLEVWYANLNIDRLRAQLADSVDPASLSKSQARQMKAAQKAVEKAKAKDSTRAIAKLTEVVDGRLRVKSDPPIVVPLRELAAESGHAAATGLNGVDMAELVKSILLEYRLTLSPDKRHLVDQYVGVDIARKVVGVGSVGTRAWIVVMEGASREDPLVLQVKEASESVLERFVGKSRYREPGRRVVEGQRAVQASSDILLGWCRVPDARTGEARHYYVRQLWDGKGSIDLQKLPPSALKSLAAACGWTLARAHARTGDRFAIAGYLGKKDVFDRAIAAFATAYADQNEADYARFLQARADGELD